MKEHYEVKYLEEYKTALLKTYSTLTREDVEALVRILDTDFKGKDIRNLLVDASQASNDPLTKDARKALKEHSHLFDYEKIAVIGANPAVRMITKVALVMIGHTKTSRFFHRIEDALSWLSGSL